MNPEPSFSDADRALEPEGSSARSDPQRSERPGEGDGWPPRWDWEQDNVADGQGVGPFPARRKPPKRAERFRLTPPDEPEPGFDE
jgi:hypothetical protein